jgi:hypothetical protein
MFEVVQCNSVLISLVTGFESYCKKRFVELEGEGIVPDLAGIMTLPSLRSYSVDELGNEAKQSRMSPVRHLVEVRDSINFQNFDFAKKAYNKTYKIKFGNIGLDGNSINRLRRFFSYRHRIVHVSPIVTPLSDLPQGDSKKLDIPNKMLAHEAVETFAKFIELMHKATLELRAPGHHVPAVEKLIP